MIKRIFFSLALLISVFFCPFWLSFLIAFAGMLVFSFFWEAILLFFISDLLFGTKQVRFFDIIVFSSTIITLILLLTEMLKKKLKVYEKKQNGLEIF